MLSGAKVIIAGGTGFLGTSLSRHLAGLGAEIVILSRGAPPPGPWRHAAWDGRTLGAWAAELEGAAALVNLCGRTVDCVKTPDHRDEILRSRVESTAVLGAACRAAAAPPPVWAQMSTAHIYGDPPRELCDESSAFGYGLAPDVGRAWEAAFAAAKLPGQRGVIVRTSFVIGRSNPGGAGALGKLGQLARWGLGGRVGAGTQGMSWIHELDQNRVFERALLDPTMEGAYIASSPNPASQADFMRTLRRHAGGLGGLGLGLPAAEWMVRLGAPLLMDTDPELALYGRYLRPSRLLDSGFDFRFPELDGAIADLYAQPR